ncbi:MAG: hypothetical protein HXY53_05735 [Nitrospirae bacterium]|nr:hypothetical protein [Nitrospirota bacterium]
MNKSEKQQFETLLKKRDFDSLLFLYKKDRKIWQKIRTSLYAIDETIRWPAIEAVGFIMKSWWESGHEEKVRNYIRTLFWSITDESGGIGWSSPQTIAEIICNIPELIDPYGSMMIAYAIDEPPLIKGCLWGIGRLGDKITDSVDFFKEKILMVFQTDDIEIFGLAAWAMGEVCFKPALPFLEKLKEIETPVKIYVKGEFREEPLSSWVYRAVAKIEIK